MDGQDLKKFGETLVSQVAAAVVARGRQQPLGDLFGSTGAGGDATKSGDAFAEAVIIEGVLAAHRRGVFPYAFLVSEETGIREIGDAALAAQGIFIIIDPVDGSPNMRPWITPAPYLAIGLALGRWADIEAAAGFDAVLVGMVQDIFHGDRLVAVRGGGAWYNGQLRLRCSPQLTLEGAIIGTSLDASGAKFDARLQQLLPVLRAKAYQRRLGSTILDLSRVATGDYDAYVAVKSKNKIHDLAAVGLVIQEAGGQFIAREQGLDYTGTFLRRLATTRDSRIIEQTVFDVVAAGTPALMNELKLLLAF